ncbi:MAG: hypothetical protein IKQ17_11195 [Kiritimatiellae bacterium]|nr:hypothetical protein [Kiritimatiellia bacterium]
MYKLLFSNGDFVTRSNEIETVCRRINPDDWDDDGIHNERDANPASCDGDFFGVANALPTNANPDAYYWLDLSVTGVLGVATIRVTCDGPSDLGDHLIIARTNQVCHIPLLAGATYAVESDLPIDDAVVSSEYAEIATNSTSNLTVSLPLELTFERVQMRGGSDSYVAHTSPVDVGPRILNIAGGCCSCVTNDLGFSWNCFPQCLCGGSEHSLSGAAKWEGYSYTFSWWGRCHCYYEDQAAIDEIESRGVSLEILDASGSAIEWKHPVLVGEPVIVKAAGTACLMASCGASCSTKKQCQQQADVFYYSGHGEHDTGRLYGVAVPSDVTNHWRDVDTVVFAGCAVLDIGDKGNHYSNPASHSASPGLKWAAASGAGVLLGYAYYAPLDDKGGMEILEAWCGQRSALGDIEAWMRANDRRCGHNACAIRRMDGTSLEYHYFVKRARLYWSRQIDSVQQGE